MDFGKTNDERMLVETARKYGEDWLREQEREHERERRFGEDAARAYAELGFTHLGVPEDLGGLALPLPVRALVWETLAGADPSASLVLSPWEVAAGALSTFEAGREVLASGFGGAVVVADDVEVRGGAVSADIAWFPAPSVEWLLLIGADVVLWFDDPPSAPLANRPCGLQAGHGTEIRLEATPATVVGDRALVDECLVEAWSLASAAMLGAARDAHAYACNYARERVAFGKPIAHHQGLAFLLMEGATDLDGAGLLHEAACTTGALVDVANAHVHVGRTAGRIAEQAVQVLGGHGYLYDHPVEKRMRDIRALSSLFGGLDHAATVAARHVLDTPGLLELRGQA